ncbi:copper-binding protein [Pseudomonas aeruginosa]|jgi:Cu/Ag efflux protein CusF|nr:MULTISPECIES: copper-binding protein [Pseudomonas]KFJ91429.1 copper-binding protein [Pseudomonas sp. 1-7]KIL05086.1 copper-binding protein [Stutzerimonas stutzeri]MPS43509.1 copper-binding protein [Stenotrophomonas sp.]ERU44226.1 hypothetical protein Q092_01199 [Pseudomonas aeruginosa CF77]MBG7041172.1 copper-binding protein [Pseudomonas aeruginosa]
MKSKAIFAVTLGAMLSVTAAAWTPGAFAQAAPANQAAAPASADLTDGEIRKVDKTTGKITIKHGRIKHLDMPAMTMVFQARDATLLDKVQAGDKVRFGADKDGEKLIVTDIQPIR